MKKNVDLEAQIIGGPDNFIDNKEIRHKFITKVFTILTAQIVLTIAIAVAFLNVNGLRDFIIRNGTLVHLFTAIPAFLVLMALSCFTSLRRTFPLNFFLLFFFTVLIAIETSVLCVFSPIKNVYAACYLTAGLFVLLTAFAYSNIFDFSNCFSTLYISSIILTLLASTLLIISAIFKIEFQFFFVIILILMLMLTIAWIIWDIQIILGKGKVALSEEEYILAAIFLYIDIINLFQMILELLNQTSND